MPWWKRKPKEIEQQDASPDPAEDMPGLDDLLDVDTAVRAIDGSITGTIVTIDENGQAYVKGRDPLGRYTSCHTELFNLERIS